MDETIELAKYDALLAYARMTNTLDYSIIEPLLADDFQYASQWIWDEDMSKQEYLDYIKNKLEVISKTNYPTYAEMAELIPYSGCTFDGPCVVIALETKVNIVATVLAEVKGKYIKRLDMCFIPPPHMTKRSGIYPN